MFAYYNYEFVSPEPIFARIKEENRTYFDTGVVDDLLFESYLSEALSKFSKAQYRIEESVLKLQDFEANLPDNFKGAREVWLCTTEGTIRYPDQASYWYQKDCRVTRINDACNECSDQYDECCTPVHTYNACDPCDTCGIPEKYRVTHKVTGETILSFRKQYLLRPGNVSKLKSKLPCKNFSSKSTDTFDIADCKIRTNFNEGMIYLIYYAEQFETSGYQMIPDNTAIIDYVRKYLTFKVYDLLYKQATTETFNQRRIMRTEAMQEADEAFVIADIETKKSTVDKKIQFIKQSYNRFRRFNIR